VEYAPAWPVECDAFAQCASPARATRSIAARPKNAVNNTTFDVMQTAVFGIVGYPFCKLKCEPAPLVLGFILGPMMEEKLRRAMFFSRADRSTFVTRPLSLSLLIAAAARLVIVTLPAIKSKREEAFQEAE
jgi:putative tricarboxylic transport membrane protein